MSQSKNMMAHRITAVKIGILIQKKTTAAANEARITPVHRAHTGNWYPLKKKLRSGI